MLLDTPLSPADPGLHDRAAWLNSRYAGLGGAGLLTRALADRTLGEIAMVSSFGADSVVLLHMLSQVAPDTPVLFIDTEMLFAETLEYQRELAGHLGLTDVRRITPRRQDLLTRDNEGLLHLHDPDACCNLRKTEPLQRGLAAFDTWITGRKRYQGGARATLDLFEAEGEARLKINPLADWSRDDLSDYIDRHGLPRHPLVAKGYPSLGCTPCTTKVAPGEDERAGRWRHSDKDECGIHFVDGKLVRTPLPRAS